MADVLLRSAWDAVGGCAIGADAIHKRSAFARQYIPEIQIPEIHKAHEHIRDSD